MMPAVCRSPDRPHAAYRLVYRAAVRADGLACWIARPEHADPMQTALVAVHGIGRGADQQASSFAPRAAAMGRIVVAPLFDAAAWPRYQRLAGGADAALDRLLDGLSSELSVPLGRVDLFGFSGGAQFAHRYAMLQPGRIRRLSVASAGWYTCPGSAPYPFGLGPSAHGTRARAAAMQHRLDQFLRLPIDVHVGERDTRRDGNTRRGDALDRQQGRHRRARAARWTEALAIEAAVRGIASRVRFSVLPNCGHDFRRCVQQGGLVERVLNAWPDAGVDSTGSSGESPPIQPLAARVLRTTTLSRH